MTESEYQVAIRRLRDYRLEYGTATPSEEGLEVPYKLTRQGADRPCLEGSMIVSSEINEESRAVEGRLLRTLVIALSNQVAELEKRVA